MVRLMLVLAPVMCILSGIAASHLLSKYIKNVDAVVSSSEPQVNPSKKFKKYEQNKGIKSEIALGFVVLISFMLITYTFHCTWVTSEAYSSPSIVLSARSEFFEF